MDAVSVVNWLDKAMQQCDKGSLGKTQRGAHEGEQRCSLACPAAAASAPGDGATTAHEWLHGGAHDGSPDWKQRSVRREMVALRVAAEGNDGGWAAFGRSGLVTVTYEGGGTAAMDARLTAGIVDNDGGWGFDFATWVAHNADKLEW
ncbi:hypothetical protein SESBI_18301 [Sesbania bispinosa]|nr:hypothetical protein SESBI_18301 [Sesbania bispinosa]